MLLSKWLLCSVLAEWSHGAIIPRFDVIKVERESMVDGVAHQTESPLDGNLNEHSARNPRYSQVIYPDLVHISMKGERGKLDKRGEETETETDDAGATGDTSSNSESTDSITAESATNSTDATISAASKKSDKSDECAEFTFMNVVTYSFFNTPNNWCPPWKTFHWKGWENF